MRLRKPQPLIYWYHYRCNHTTACGTKQEENESFTSIFLNFTFTILNCTCDADKCSESCAAYLADGDKAVQNRLNITAVRHLIRTKNSCLRREILHAVFLAHAVVVVFIVRPLLREPVTQDAAAIGKRAGGEVDVPELAARGRLVQKLFENGGQIVVPYFLSLAYFKASS